MSKREGDRRKRHREKVDRERGIGKTSVSDPKTNPNRKGSKLFN